MKAKIVDDEPLARKRISDLLTEFETVEVVRECSSGKKAVHEINKLMPDVVFLDINLKDLNGFQVLQKINVFPKPAVIFVTAYDKHAQKAFDFEAFDFLLKPFKEERFFKTMDKVFKTNQKQVDENFDKIVDQFFKINDIPVNKFSSKLPVRQGNKTVLLEKLKIEYILASGYYAEIYKKDKKYVTRESLNNLIEILDPRIFFRVHRSAIINLNFVQEIINSGYSEIDVRMKDNRLVRISKSQKRKFLSKLGY